MAAVLNGKRKERLEEMKVGDKMMKRYIRRIWPMFLVLTLLLCIVFSASAKVVYVRVGGDDLNDGLTPTTALATIERTFYKMGEGDIVDIGPGVYDDGPKQHQYAWVSYTLRGDPANRPTLLNESLIIGSNANGVVIQDIIIDASRTVSNVITIKQGARNITFRNCDIQNPDEVVIGWGHGCIGVESCDGLTVEGCRLIYRPSVGADNAYNLHNWLDQPYGASSNWTFSNTEFEVTPPPSVTNQGINIRLHESVAGMTIEGCTFLEAPTRQIEIYGTDEFTGGKTYSDWTIRNNGFHGTRQGAALWMQNPNTFINWVIDGNYFHDSNNSGILFDGEELGTQRGHSTVDGLRITNNVMLDMGDRGSSNASHEGNTAVVLEDILLTPTNGRATVISNNVIRDTRPSPAGGWGIYVLVGGAAPTIADNQIDNLSGACTLWAESPDLPFGSDLVGGLIVGNVYGDAGDGAVYMRPNGGSSGVVVQNNVASDCVGAGFSVVQASHEQIMLLNNDVWRCNAGIQNAAPGAVIRGNEIYNCVSQAGIRLGPDRTGYVFDISNVLVSFNVVSGNNGYGIFQDSVLSASSQGGAIYNNTVVNNGNDGILIGIDNVDVYNNIIALHSGTGFIFSAATTGDIGYNLHFNPVGSNFSGFASSAFPGDVFANPGFTNILSQDYTLQPTSPAVGAGASLAGGVFSPNNSDLGAIPVFSINTNVKQSAWDIYR
jgi:Right handed beta helix region